MRTMRIVKRQNQREKLAELQAMVTASRPLIEADKQLRRAYIAGYTKRLKEEKQELEDKQKAFQGSLDPALVDEAVAQELSQEQPTRPIEGTDVTNEMQAISTDENEQIRDVVVAKHPELVESLEQPLEPGNDTNDQGTAKTNQ